MAPTTSATYRFSIATLLLGTGTTAILLNYLRERSLGEILPGLLAVAVIAVPAFLWSFTTGRVAATWFWASVGAVTAYLCSVGQPLNHEAFHVGWPLVGATAAGLTMHFTKLSLPVRMLGGATCGTAVLFCCSLAPSSLGATHAWTEVACAPVAATIMVGVVWVLNKLHTWRQYSHSFLVFSLTAGVVGGNALGLWLGWL